MILRNFILLWAFTVYMENSQRSEICTKVSSTTPEVMWTLIMKLPHTEVKFRTGLSSLRVSCKRAPGHDGISFNIIKNCFGPLSTHLLNNFQFNPWKKEFFQKNLKQLVLPLSIRLVMEMILEFTDQFLFYLVCFFSIKCLKEFCIRDFIITYCKTTYIQNNLTFKRVIQQNML